jgi:hypothetical protein
LSELNSASQRPGEQNDDVGRQDPASEHPGWVPSSSPIAGWIASVVLPASGAKDRGMSSGRLMRIHGAEFQSMAERVMRVAELTFRLNVLAFGTKRPRRSCSS